MTRAVDLRRRCAGKWEHAFPWAIGSGCAIAWLAGGHNVVSHAAESGWNLENIYGALFDLATVFTGFLSAFYGIVQSGDGKYISRIRDTLNFHTFIRFLRSAIICGATFSIFCIPFLIVEPLPKEPLSWEQFPLAVWAGFAGYSFSAFWRVARSFFILLDE